MSARSRGRSVRRDERARAAARPVRRDRRRGVGRIALPGRRCAVRPAHRPAGARRPRGRRALGAPRDRPADAVGCGDRRAPPGRDGRGTPGCGSARDPARRPVAARPGGDRAAGPARPRPVADRAGATVRQGAAGDPGRLGVGGDRPGCRRGDRVLDPRPRRRARPTGAGRRTPGRPAGAPAAAPGPAALPHRPDRPGRRPRTSRTGPFGAADVGLPGRRRHGLAVAGRHRRAGRGVVAVRRPARAFPRRPVRRPDPGPEARRPRPPAAAGHADAHRRRHGPGRARRGR